MPITRSAKKALRQNATRKTKNLQRKTTMRALVKQVKKFTLQKKTEEAKALMPQVFKALDKAAKGGVLKKNAAARRKSRLTKLLEESAKASQ